LSNLTASVNIRAERALERSNAEAFLAKVRATPADWPYEAIVEHLLSRDPVGIGALAARGLLAAGVLLPTEAAKRRVAERLALAVLREHEPPESLERWLADVAREAADSLRFDGLQTLTEDARRAFLSRLAACLGVGEERAVAALAALHTFPPEQVAALRGCLPPTWGAVALQDAPLEFDPALATAAVRGIIRSLAAAGTPCDPTDA